MRIFNELRYPSSNLSEIFTQRMFQASFEKIWKIFFELSRGQAWSYGRTDRQTDRQTDGQTDRQTDRRTDAGNDNTPPALGPRGKNDLSIICTSPFPNNTCRLGNIIYDVMITLNVCMHTYSWLINNMLVNQTLKLITRLYDVIVSSNYTTFLPWLHLKPVGILNVFISVSMCVCLEN